LQLSILLKKAGIKYLITEKNIRANSQKHKSRSSKIAGTALLLGFWAKIKPPADKKLFINRW
jgi:hypothetical protein